MAQSETFEERLRRMVKVSGVSAAVLGDVLERVMISAPSPVPRVDIATGAMRPGLSPLSAGTVSKATKVLTDEGFLGEEPRHFKTSGRPTIPMSLGRTTRHDVPRFGLIGIHVGLEANRCMSLHAVLTTLDGEVRKSVGTQGITITGDPLEPVDALDAIQVAVQGLLPAAGNDLSGVSVDEVLGIGIDIAGHVHGGQIVEMTHGRTSWHDVDIATELSARLHDLHVVVDNDVNVLAVLETYKPRFPQRDVAMVAVFDEGVGASLILDGRVYRGAHGMVAEVGHCRVPDEHLETRAGTAAATNDGLVRFSDPCHCGKNLHVDCFAPARLRGELGLRENDEITFLRVAEEMAHTDSGRRTPTAEVFYRGGRALGHGIVNIINIANPGRVVVLLPPVLKDAQKGQAAAEYKSAMEATVSAEAFSTGGRDARAGEAELYLDELDTNEVGQDSARASAVRVLDSFLEDARDLDHRSRNGRPHMEKESA